MRPPKPPPIVYPREPPERIWPLDVSMAALAGLVLYVTVTRLRFDDPRWLYNAWTYAVAVPLVALAMAVCMHGIVSRYVQKSIQVGFLFSVFVHLLLLLLAINVVIFSRYQQSSISGIQPEKSPVRRTVPDYLFQTPQKETTTPDWSQPIEAETTSRVIPQEQRELPPMEYTEPKLELPKPQPQETRPLRRFLMQRQQPVQSQPLPTDSPTRSANRQRSDPRVSPWTSRSPTAPDLPVPQAVTPGMVQRELSEPQRQSPSESKLSPAAPTNIPIRASAERSLAGARSRSDAMPMIGEAGVRRERRQAASSQQVRPAGSAPTPQTVAVAREDAAADRMMAPVEVPVARQGQTAGAQLTLGQTATTGLAMNPDTSQAVEQARNNLAARSGMPDIAAGNSRRVPGRTRRSTVGFGVAPAGAPDPTRSIAAPNDGKTDDGGNPVGDRLAQQTVPQQSSRSRASSATPSLTAPSASGMPLDMMLREGPSGLVAGVGSRAGVVTDDDQPEIASLDLARSKRPRREVGGPVTPFGTKIAAVESFSRRVLRTRGGANATPAGMVGPATEEAIERGLAYLASIQNDDGSWSLQGHGSKVLLRSDTAATGLCLLAYQGAGYTHRQHQYADTVSRGLKFLLDSQRTNGDLYRRENAISDQNVSLYSHGIAALALCEAYGMTQDDELKEPAQASLRYISNTQHRRRGGWRYTPQVSADTSVTGWMMMALKSGQLSGLEVPEETYQGIQRWLTLSQSPQRPDRYRYNPFAPDTPTQRHGRLATPTMTAVGMLMRMYSGWRRDNQAMQSAADYLLEYPPQMGTDDSPQRDAYYWYYATQVMFHMGENHWDDWNRSLNPMLLESQVKEGVRAGSWDPLHPVPDRWSAHAGRLYVTTMNLLNLEVFYRHLPIYEDTAD